MKGFLCLGKALLFVVILLLFGALFNAAEGMILGYLMIFPILIFFECLFKRRETD